MSLALAALALLAGCGDRGPEEPRPLFPEPPGVQALASDFDLAAVLGEMPVPRFQSLDYVQDFESATQRVPVRQFIETATLLEARGALSALQIEYTFIDSDPDDDEAEAVVASTAQERVLQAGGLITLMRQVSNPRGAGQVDVSRSFVELIENATGSLFPFSRGNRVDFTLVRKIQNDPAGAPRRAPRTLDFDYSMGVIKPMNPAIYSELELTDQLWVINIESIDPDGARTGRQVHFSTEIGMPVYDERRTGSTITRRRLVSWVPPDGERRGVAPIPGDEEPDAPLGAPSFTP